VRGRNCPWGAVSDAGGAQITSVTWAVAGWATGERFRVREALWPGDRRAVALPFQGRLRLGRPRGLCVSAPHSAANMHGHRRIGLQWARSSISALSLLSRPAQPGHRPLMAAMRSIGIVLLLRRAGTANLAPPSPPSTGTTQAVPCAQPSQGSDSRAWSTAAGGPRAEPPRLGRGCSVLGHRRHLDLAVASAVMQVQLRR
jgi:hypothetical protein